MGKAKNALEIYTILEKSNCRECGEKTCLAFAGAVFRGVRRLADCPKLGVEVAGRYAMDAEDEEPNLDRLEASILAMKKDAAALDFAATAGRVGGQLQNAILQVRMLGKLIGLHKDGSISTDLHHNPWVVVPFLHYLLTCRGSAVTETWISFRELPGGKEKYALFKKQGEDVLLQLADRYPEFFNDVIHMFDGRMVAKQFAADVSVVLYPLPLVPVMICYWRPEDGLGSTLNIYFDQSAIDNIGYDMAFSLCTGVAMMLKKIAAHHGF
jgi:hypothetical protein